jgi:putative nucleotidyltransferase with HDIG domain
MNMNSKDIKNIANNFMNKLLEKMNPQAEIYLVGGYIRDFVLNKESHDYDYVVMGKSATEFAKEFADFTGGFFVLLDEEYDIARVVMPDKINHADFAACQGKTILEDLTRRDLTINSIALKIGAENEIIDPFDGLQDIKQQKIRATSEKNILDDPLRILRVYRFASQLGFDIEENTMLYIKKHYPLIDKIAKERIHSELLKLFEGDFASQNIEKLKKTGMLYLLLPEMKLQTKIPPNLHHHLCLIDHSIETIRQFENLKSELPQWVVEKLHSEHAHGIKTIALFKLACLLHDIGKPETWEIDNEGRHRFIKHDEVGANLAQKMLKNLKFSKNQIKYISKLIKYHIYPSQLLRVDEAPSEKAVNKMFRKLEEEAPDVILLAMADRLSTQGPEITEEMTKNNIEGLNGFLEKYKELTEKNFLAPLPKLLTGDEVAEILNITRGPIIGKILAELKEAQISGDIATKEEAVAFIKNIVSSVDKEKKVCQNNKPF